MREPNIRRIWTFVLALVFTCSVAMAQSAADRLYNQGLQLQKTLTVSSQKAAIYKFQGAKKLYDSAQKKAMCDNAIAVSRNIIKNAGSVRSPRHTPKDNNKEVEHPVKKLTLSVSNSEFNLKNPGVQLTVTVAASDSDWEVALEQPKTGKSFVSAKRTGDNTITIDVERNNSYRTRTQNVVVRLDNLERTIVVNQKGQEANLDADPLKLEFKTGGQTKDLVVYCDSDVEYEDNQGCNWFIVSQPEWVNVVVENGSSKENLADKLKSWFNRKKKIPENMLPTKVQIQCLELTKGAGAAYRNGRTDYLVLGSGEKEIKILIIQKGGK